MGSDDFGDLSRPSEPRGGGDLLELVRAALGDPRGELELVLEDEEMGWLVRDGTRVSRLNLREIGRTDLDRRQRFATALAELVRRFDALRWTIDGLEVGRDYIVDYKHAELRRTFRQKGVLRAVSPWRTAEGIDGGGWSITLEVKPRFGKAVAMQVDTRVLTNIEPVDGPQTPTPRESEEA